MADELIKSLQAILGQLTEELHGEREESVRQKTHLQRELDLARDKIREMECECQILLNEIEGHEEDVYEVTLVRSLLNAAIVTKHLVLGMS